MPPSIPFLRLTPVPQLLILEYMSLEQLFHFSLLSKRANKIAKSRRRNIKELHWNADYINGTFSLMITDYESNVFKIHIPIDIHRIGNDMNRTGKITFEGRQLRTARIGETYMDIGEEDQSNEERLELFEKLTEHFMGIFNVKNYTVDVTEVADLTMCSIWKYTKTLEELSVHTAEALTAQDMELILGELTVTGQLEIHSKVAEGFQWTEPLKTRIILLEDGLFLSLNVYLNSKVEQWTIYDRTLPTTHLNAIMKKWLDGGLEELEIFKMVISIDTDEERRLNEALEGIQTFPRDRRMMPRSWDGINASNGRDMRRSDGKLATAGVDNDQFYFFVWNSYQVEQESDSFDEDED